jgi:hypothetical protein
MQNYATRSDKTLDQGKEICFHFAPNFLKIVLKYFGIFKVVLLH